MENTTNFFQNVSNLLELLNDDQLNDRELFSLRSKFSERIDGLKKQQQIAANQALFNLSNEDYYKVAKYLVQSGADLNATTEDGKCPIFHLLLKNNEVCYRLFEAFIDSGVGVDIRDCNGNTMLHKIVSTQDVDPYFVRRFLMRRPDVNAQNYNGETPLLLAVKNRCNWKIIELLLNAGASLHICDYNGNTTLSYADAELKTKIIDYSVDWGDPYLWEI